MSWASYSLGTDFVLLAGPPALCVYLFAYPSTADAELPLSSGAWLNVVWVCLSNPTQRTILRISTT